jgi:hypothetical protein
LTNRPATTDRRDDESPNDTPTPQWGLARELWLADDPETALKRWRQRVADRDVGERGGHK